MEARTIEFQPIWVQYKGLWGVKSLLNDESSPPGPQVGQTHERSDWREPAYPLG